MGYVTLKDKVLDLIETKWFPELPLPQLNLALPDHFQLDVLIGGENPATINVAA